MKKLETCVAKGRGVNRRRDTSCLRSPRRCKFTRDLEVRVRKFISVAGKIYGARLETPTFTDDCLKNVQIVKEWMSARKGTRACGRMERWGVRASLGLFKKALPDACEHLQAGEEERFKANIADEATGELPSGFLRFVRTQVRHTFRKGWDRGYEDAIFRKAPKGQACAERGRREGGNRCTEEEYIERCLGNVGEKPSPARFGLINSAGKLRPLTIMPTAMGCLLPLHDIIFGHTRKYCSWLLTGPPTVPKLEDAGFEPGKTILSGDYKSATDCLDLRVAREILGAILSRATSVPEEIKILAMESLNHTVTINGEDHKILRGTMMGFALSFPILCWYNRLCSLYALGKVPMLINGDDIIAQTDKPQKWFDVLPPLGLSPERTKTGVSKTHLNLNSTDFIVKSGKWFEVPVIRSRALFTPLIRGTDLGSTAGQFAKNFTGRQETMARMAYYSLFRKTILKCPLLPRDMGMTSRDVEALKGACLYRQLMRTPTQLLRPVPPPALTSPTGPTTSLWAPSSFARKMAMFRNFSKQFEAREFQDNAEAVKKWWEEVTSSVLRDTPYTNRFAGLVKGMRLKAHTRWFGEVLSRRELYRRFNYQFQERSKNKPLAFPTDLLYLTTQKERIGLVQFIPASK